MCEDVILFSTNRSQLSPRIFISISSIRKKKKSGQFRVSTGSRLHLFFAESFPLPTPFVLLDSHWGSLGVVEVKGMAYHCLSCCLGRVSVHRSFSGLNDPSWDHTCPSVPSCQGCSQRCPSYPLAAPLEALGTEIPWECCIIVCETARPQAQEALWS